MICRAPRSTFDSAMLCERVRLPVRHTESFDRRRAARAWLARRETELAPALGAQCDPDPEIHEAIDLYTDEKLHPAHAMPIVPATLVLRAQHRRAHSAASTLVRIGRSSCIDQRPCQQIDQCVVMLR